MGKSALELGKKNTIIGPRREPGSAPRRASFNPYFSYTSGPTTRPPTACFCAAARMPHGIPPWAFCRARPPAPSRLSDCSAGVAPFEGGRGLVAFKGVRASCAAAALRQWRSACLAASTRSWAAVARFRPPGSPGGKMGTATSLFHRRPHTVAGTRPRTGWCQGWPSRAESRSRESRLGDSAKMSDSATRRLGDSGLTRAVTRPQGSVTQDHMRSHCSCALH